MTRTTRNIGLSLGADICWPICYEELMKRLQLAIPYGKERVSFEVSRVTIEPFELQKRARFDLIIDRLTHWYHPSREWIKKSIVMDDAYVFNNPWSLQSMEKQTTYCAMMRLGLPVPETWLLPPKDYLPTADLAATLERYARLFDLGTIGKEIGYPLYMKPYDGGAWVGVTRIENEDELRKAYDESGFRVMHLQAGVQSFDRFVRCIGLGPQVRLVDYNPEAPMHDRYGEARGFLDETDNQLLADIILTINSFFGWDFNSAEVLRSNDVWHPIDFANACPDSQVTSLHSHFPWLIKANLRWSIFCATVGKRMQRTLNWDAFFEVAASDLDYRSKISSYARIAHERFETDRFEAFCEKYLTHLDEIALEFFATDTARNAVLEKVRAVFPEKEVEAFTELFWTRIQRWRETEGKINGLRLVAS